MTQGVLESFLGHLLAGGVFCLFAGQPLTILGSTGPVLVFEKILFKFCKSVPLQSNQRLFIIKIVQSDKLSIGTMVMHVNIKDGTLFIL